MYVKIIWELIKMVIETILILFVFAPIITHSLIEVNSFILEGFHLLDYVDSFQKFVVVGFFSMGTLIVFVIWFIVKLINRDNQER